MIKPYGGGQTPDRLLMEADKKRLWILAILFVTVLAIIFGAQIAGNIASKQAEENRDPEKRPGGDNAPIDVAAPRDDTGRTGFSGTAPSVQHRRDLAENDLGLALSKLAEVGELVNGRKEDSPKVLDYLLQQVVWEYQITTLPDHVYRRLPTEKAEHDPAPWRGRLTSAFGKLVTKGPLEDYPSTVDQVGQLQRAVFRTAEGELFHVTTTMEIERNIGEWIQVYGIYFRNRPVTLDGREESAFALVVGKRADIAYPPITVTSVDPAWASEILDQSYDQASRLEERPVWLLMNYAKNLDLDEYRAKRDSGAIEIVDFGDKARPLVRRADEYRLEHISAIGKIITPIVEHLDHDNPGKIERLDSGILLQPSGYFVRLMSARPWDDYGIRAGDDFVRVQGVFVKRWQYIPDGSNIPLEIPLVIVTDIELVDKVSVGMMKTLRWVFLVIALGIVGVFVTIALKDRKARAAFRDRVREKARQRGEED